MCGICGYVCRKELSDEKLIEMNDTMFHRGPDDSGIYQLENSNCWHIGIAHRRLSIMDLSELGHQPMLTKDKSCSIVFNGEIYNFLEIKNILLEKGYEFTSKCDTEVILAAYQEYGIKCLNLFNGMFAIALYDRRENKLFLARDRIGKKPLYYYINSSGELVFGSELKPIMKHPAFRKEIATDVLARYFCYKYINAPDTIFKDTYKVKPGEYVIWQDGRITTKCYWNILEVSSNKKLEKIDDYSEAKKGLKDLLIDSVSRRLVSDVPVGTFLSGGIDSTLITAIASKIVEKPIKTYSIGFYSKKENEAQYAKNIAKYLETDHTEMYISSKELFEMVHDIPRYYDEPFADSSQIPSMLVSKLAKQSVTVALSGDGGDELFCGYSAYDWIFWAQKFDLFGGVVNGLIDNTRFKELLPDKLKALLNNRNENTKVQLLTDIRQKHALELINGNSKSIKYAEESAISDDNWQSKRMLLEMITNLPGDMLTKVDRASMKYSLEVRCPILDYRIIEYSFRVPHEFKYFHGEKKHILKDITYDFVPRSFLDRPKMGFGVPLSEWLRNELNVDLLRYADNSILEKQGIFNIRKVNWFLEKIKNDDASFYATMLWDFYVFQMWYQEYIQDLWN